MKAKLTHVLIALLFSAPVFTQIIFRDSLQALTSKVIETSKEIDGKKIKLAQNQSDLEKRRAQIWETSEKAQALANANTVAARELTKNPQDKKLVRKASSGARDTQRDAKNARKSSDNVQTFNLNYLFFT